MQYLSSINHSTLPELTSSSKLYIKNEWKEDCKVAKGNVRYLQRITNKKQVHKSMMLYTTVNTQYQTANESLFTKSISPPDWHRILFPVHMQQWCNRECGALPDSLLQI